MVIYFSLPFFQWCHPLLIGSFATLVMERVFRKSPLLFGWQAVSLAEPQQLHYQSVGLGLGVLLLNLIPQFQYSLESEINLQDPNSKLPQLFLFDIQEEHIQSLTQTLEFQGRPLQNLTPWIRGRSIAVKGVPFESMQRMDREFTTRTTKEGMHSETEHST